MGEEYGIYYQPELAAERARHALRSLLYRVASMLVSIGVMAALWAVWPSQFGDWAPWFIGFSAVAGGVSSLVMLFVYLGARKDAKAATVPLAIGMNREGMLIAQHWYPWTALRSLVAKPGILGRSTKLIASGTDGWVERVPLTVTDAKPASVDSVARVFSDGLVSVDLTRLY